MNYSQFLNKMKYTLIYDGNFFVQKTMAVSKDLFKIEQTPKQKERSKEEFINTLCMHFASDMRKFSEICDSVIFCVDSKSWRKDYFPIEDYKGTRTKSSEITLNNSLDFRSLFVILLFSESPSLLLSMRHLSQSSMISASFDLISDINS